MLVNSANLFYYLALLIYCLSEIFSYTMIGQNLVPSNQIYLLCILLIIVKIFLSRVMNLRQMVFWICGAILILFLYFNYGYTRPLIIILFLFGAENCSADLIAKIHFYSVGSITFLATLLSQVGMVTDRVFYRNGILARHSMGMTYVTIWAGIVGFLLIEYLYIHRKAIKVRHIIIYISIIIYSYIMTSTRIELIINAVFLLLVIFYPYIKKRISGRFLAFSFPAAAIISYLLQFAYSRNPSGLQIIDTLLSHRLYETKKVLDQYSITLFGNAIKMQGHGTVNFDDNLGYFFVDSVYMNYLVQFGIIFMGFLIIVITLLSYRLYKENKKFLLCVLSLTALHGIIISTILVPYFDPFYLIGYALLSDKTADSGEPVFQINISFKFSRETVGLHLN